jgi:hypothetical protein
MSVWCYETQIDEHPTPKGPSDGRCEYNGDRKIRD